MKCAGNCTLLTAGAYRIIRKPRTFCYQINIIVLQIANINVKQVYNIWVKLYETLFR